jgi:hypothetical protein
VRFIAFIECAEDDLDGFIAIWDKRVSARHIVKTLIPPHTIADAPRGYKGFTIFETDNIEDIMHFVTEYGRIAKIQVFPIWESSKGADLYKKMKAGL